MLYWIPYAFVRISVFFIAGIVLGVLYPRMIPIQYAVATLGGLVALYFLIFLYNRSRRRTVINPGLVGLTAVLVGGYCNVFLSREANKPDHITNLHKPVSFYSGIVSRYGQEKDKTSKEVLSVTSVFDGEEWLPATGDVLLVIRKDSTPAGIRYGDRLLIEGSPSPVNEPANPGEFDYRNYLANKNIYHQHFLPADKIVVAGNEPPSRLMAMSISMRLWADAALKKHIRGDRERAIASALVLGVTDGLDQDLMGAYAATGSLHVLSVSGLHVGILYLLIMVLLKPLLKWRNGKWVVALLSLCLLWLYACVTGLSPSVLRAVTMFSFMVVARPLGQRTNIYNVLGASAFLLLLFDPFLLLSVGFQLSFLAVIGIVYLQPLLYNLFEPENRFVDEIWKITTVSVAAQVATFAIGLLYFHQFPNYFLLSNLYVLPLGFVILVGGLGLLACSFFTPLAALVGWALEIVIKVLNELIFLTESLPFSVISGIHITTAQCIVLMVLITGVTLFLQHRRMWTLYAAAISCVLFSAASWRHYQHEVTPPRLAVYKVPGFSSIDLIERGHAFYFTGSNIPAEKINFHVQPNRVRHQVRNLSPVDIQPFSSELSWGRVVAWNGATILQLTAPPADDARTPLRFDYIVVSRNAIRSLDDLPGNISAGLIIIDSSNSFRNADILLRSNTAQRKVHSVWHQGAFQKTI